MFNYIFKQIEINMRELGFGDTIVNKNMKFLVKSFYSILLKCENYKKNTLKQKNLFLGDINAKIDWGYAKDYVIAAYKMMQMNKPDFFVIGTGKAHSIEYFVRKSFQYLNLDYKKYLKINKKLIRSVKTKTLVANTEKAKRIFKFYPTTSLDKLIKIMIQNDLKIEKDKG